MRILVGHGFDGEELKVAVWLACAAVVAGVEECEEAAIVVLAPGGDAGVGCF